MDKQTTLPSRRFFDGQERRVRVCRRVFLELPDMVWSRIVHFLSLRDQSRLCVTCRCASEILESLDFVFEQGEYQRRYLLQTKERLLKEVRKSEISEVLTNLLYGKVFLIAGSYPLQFLSPSCDWKAGDIDIYLWTTHKFWFGYKLRDYLRSEGFEIYFYLANSDYELQVDIRDMIFRLYDYICEHFDFSFCKIGFDGDEIYAFDFLNQIQKRGTLDHGIDRFKDTKNELAKRMEKYQARGFEVINIEMVNQILHTD